MSNVDELVEEVARAIWAECWDEPFPENSGHPGIASIDYVMVTNQAKAAIKAVRDALQEQWHNSPMKPTVIESSDDYLIGWGRCREVAGVYLLAELEDK